MRSRGRGSLSSSQAARQSIGLTPSAATRRARSSASSTVSKPREISVSKVRKSTDGIDGLRKPDMTIAAGDARCEYVAGTKCVLEAAIKASIAISASGRRFPQDCPATRREEARAHTCEIALIIHTRQSALLSAQHLMGTKRRQAPPTKPHKSHAAILCVDFTHHGTRALFYGFSRSTPVMLTTSVAA